MKGYLVKMQWTCNKTSGSCYKGLFFDLTSAMETAKKVEEDTYNTLASHALTAHCEIEEVECEINFDTMQHMDPNTATHRKVQEDRPETGISKYDLLLPNSAQPRILIEAQLEYAMLACKPETDNQIVAQWGRLINILQSERWKEECLRILLTRCVDADSNEHLDDAVYTKFVSLCQPASTDIIRKSLVTEGICLPYDELLFSGFCTIKNHLYGTAYVRKYGAADSSMQVLICIDMNTAVVDWKYSSYCPVSGQAKATEAKK